MPSKLVNRILKGDLHHTIGRFLTVRKMYSFIQQINQNFNNEIEKQFIKAEKESIFTQNSADEYVTKIRQESVSFGLQLPDSLITQIYEYAQITACKEPHYQEEFFAKEIENGRLYGGRHVLRALVNNPMNCEAIANISQDPLLVEVVKKYLGYYPTQIIAHLTWSFASEMPYSEQKKIYPPLNYHYDVAGYNFMTAYFYITDVEKDTGAHVMIKASHREKPLSWVLSDGRPPEEDIYNYYGKDKEIVIEGKKGFGFIQDPSCYHKLLPILKGKRLILLIRYS